ncbi:MAG: T9SS type A sorting domain-containing protein [bacterium]
MVAAWVLPPATVSYNNQNGVTSSGWNNGSSSLVLDEYYEYSVQTPNNATWVVTGIQFTHDKSGGSWDYAVYYSTDNFLSSRLYSYMASQSVSSGPVEIRTQNGISKNISIPINTKLQFRVYAWNTSPGTSRTYSNLNFIINGSTAQATLPVTLSSFTAKQTTDNNISLGWVTSSESVNKGFSIERQEESGGKFQSLGFIPSKAEGGNSQTTLAYSFKDVTAKKGTNMYRLVQEDLDGKKTYSEVRVVKLSAQSVSNVYPNPSNGAINISRTNDGKKMNLQLLDQSGRVISQVNNITDANYRMNISQSGIYSIKMMYPESGEQSIQRIVVQK